MDQKTVWQSQWHLHILDNKMDEPICPYCNKEMINVIDSITKKLSPYSWSCNCKGFPKDIILMKG